MNQYEFKALRTAPQFLPPGTPEWCEGMSVLVQSSFSGVERYGARRLSDYLKESLPHEPWKHVPLDAPANHPRIWLEGVTGHPWKATKLIVEVLDEELARLIDQLCGRQGATVALAETVPSAREVGRPEKVDIPENINSNPGGTSATYRTAKLKRDHPEIAERMAAGEFKSVAEAERAAGVREPVEPSTRINLPKDPEAAARKILAKFGQEFAGRLADALRMAQ
jgi:hypothetical protein